MELFRGNWNAHGTEAGGSVRHEGDLQLKSWAQVTALENHLNGTEFCGVYPMAQFSDGTWNVHWGCVDFDEGDEVSWVHARNLAKVLRAFGIAPWIERSRSKGYHVWVFLDTWTDPALVRYALLAACQIVDAPTKEINPKQVSLAEGQLGNYVRLPYPGRSPVIGSDFQLRRCMVDDIGAPWSFDDFVKTAWEFRTQPIQLEPLRELYKEPERPRPVVVAPTMDGDPVRRMGGLAYTIWKDGPLDGSDRSGTLFKLAALLREGGQHTFSEALELVWDADGRWGKFHDRPRGYEDLTKVVEGAWR